MHQSADGVQDGPQGGARGGGLQLWNTGLRGAALLAKFATLVLFARYLDLAEVGLFGILYATISLCTLLVGGEFYAYAQRKIIGGDPVDRSSGLQHHIAVLCGSYAVILPLLSLLFVYEVLPISLTLWFYGLLVVEHVSQEAGRLLIALERQLLASILLFLRHGAWGLLASLVMAIEPDARSLPTVLWFWMGVGVVSGLLGSFYSLRLAGPLRFVSWDWSWVKRGLLVSAIYMTAAISIRLVTTVDRHILQFLDSLQAVGVYTVYAGVAMAVVTFLDAAVLVFAYPRLLRHYNAKAWQLFFREERRLVLGGLGWGVALGGGALIAGPYVFAIAGQEELLRNLNIYWILVLGSFCYAVSMIPHYLLYAARADVHILVAHLSGIAVFGSVILLARATSPAVLVASALAATFAWMFLYKAGVYVVIRRSLRLLGKSSTDEANAQFAH